MRTWVVLLSGLLVWTVHFFGVYGAASVFPGTALARWLTGLITLLALGTLGLVSFPIVRRRGLGDNGDLSGWIDGLALAGVTLSAIAIVYQGLPALTA